MAIESRSAWGARAPRSVTRISSTKGVKAHYTGGRVDPATLTDHAKCRAAIRGIQNGHMDGNGWADIAYSMWVCNHTAGMGRGPGVLTAANGPGLNAGHYSILFLVGTSGVTAPTDAMKRHFHEARDYLRSHGGAGKEIKGHRDGYATDCPGDPIYKWIKAGAPKPGAATPAPAPAPEREPEGDDVPDYISYEFKNAPAIDVPPGDGWVKVTWNKENSDPTDEHSGTGYTMLLGDPSVYNFNGFVRWAGLQPGDRVEMRVCEYLYHKAEGSTPAYDELKEIGWESTSVLSRDLVSHHSDTGSVAKGRKLVLEVRHSGTGTAQIVAAGAKLTAWQ